MSLNICNIDRFVNTFLAFKMEIFGKEGQKKDLRFPASPGLLEKEEERWATSNLTCSRRNVEAPTLILHANFQRGRGSSLVRAGPFSSRRCMAHPPLTYTKRLTGRFYEVVLSDIDAEKALVFQVAH